MKLPTLDSLKPDGKTVLVRADLNVPMEGGRVADATRITRLLPTLKELLQKRCKVVVLSHFARPEGTFVPAMSLAPLVDALAGALGGREVKFGVDCVGPAAREAVAKTPPGGIILLENLRFHAEEQKNDAAFARELASLGDIYVNDAFSCSHRAHASVVGITAHLPSVAGRLMQEELRILSGIFDGAARPLTAIIGGAKISSKLSLLENLIGKVDNLVIGGAMANTFLLAQGHSIGKSLVETNLKVIAKRIIAKAARQGCTLILPTDVMVGMPASAIGVEKIPASRSVLDVGDDTLDAIAACLKHSKTVVWNGPLGLCETAPFDISTLALARRIARLTRDKKIKSIAGGGDTIAAITRSGLAAEFTYLSTAGGAFLEWLEGRELPGIAALAHKTTSKMKEAL